MTTQTAKIRVGSVVRIIQPDYRFSGKQGVVVKIATDKNKDGPIGVRFPKWNKNLFDHPDGPDTVVRFKSSELQVDDRFDPMPESEYFKTIFGTLGVWQSFKPIYPLIPGESQCMYQGCRRLATFEIWINSSGIARMYYVCPAHAIYHGVCNDSADDLPLRHPEP